MNLAKTWKSWAIVAFLLAAITLISATAAIADEPEVATSETAPSLAAEATSSEATDTLATSEDADTAPSEEASASSPEELASFRAESSPAATKAQNASSYTVEFIYNEKEYVLDGGSSVALGEILDALGLAGAVSAVEVSDDQLFAASNESGEWMVTAKKAFTSPEWMKVTVDGIVYEIVVTDAAGDVSRDVGTDEWIKNGGWEVSGSYVLSPGPDWNIGTININRNGSLQVENANFSGGVINVNNAGSTHYAGWDGDRENYQYALNVREWTNQLTVNGTTINNNGGNKLLRTKPGGKATLVGAALDGKNNDYSGGSVIKSLNNSSIILKDGTTIQNFKNAAFENNGTMTVDSGTVTIKDSEIKLKGSNRIVVKAGATLVLDNVDLSFDNQNTGIKVEDGGTLIINGGKIHDWKGSTDDSCISATNATVKITDTEIYNNTNSRHSQGASIIRVVGGTLELNNVDAHDNEARTFGGVAFVKDATAVVDGGTFKDNKTVTNGGAAICALNSDLAINGATFENNLAPDGQFSEGGAIYQKGGTLTVDDEAKFIGNNGHVGGAIYLLEVADATIGKATFENNGNIYGSSSSVNPNFKWWDTNDGGAIYIDKSIVTLNGTTFNGNEAWGNNTSSGGAVYATGDSTKLAVNGATFTDNHATTYGGAVTVAKGARATILDLEGTPTTFVGNTVDFGRDFAGGALFINLGYVEMQDAAIYENYADDAGGGLSTCTTGTAEVRVLDGSAIFNNGVGEASNFPAADIQSKKDIFFQTTDHKDQDTGEDIAGRGGFQAYDVELYERMFNGGLHNWSVEEVSMTNDQGNQVKALVGQSSPTNTDVSGAKVVFTQNAAYRYPDEEGQDPFTVSGGAIGCNGLLVMGTKAELKVLKVWEDNGDNDGYRPTKEEYKKLIEDGKLAIKDGEGNTVNLAAAGLQIDVVDAKDYDLSSNVATGDDDTEALQKLADEKDTYLIVISGLEPGDYEVVSDQVESYTSSVSADSKRALINKHVDDQVKVSVEKKWDDADDYDKIRPSEVTIKLLKNGENTGQTLVLKASEGWKGAFGDLVAREGGKDVEYTVEEVVPDGYTATYSGTATEGFVVKNAHAPNPTDDNDGNKTHVGTGSVDVKITKQWADNNNVAGIRPDSVTVTLLADGEPATDKMGNACTLVLNEENNWAGGFTDLYEKMDGVDIAYTVVEAAVDGYRATYSGSRAEGFVVTNTIVLSEDGGDKPTTPTTEKKVKAPKAASQARQTVRTADDVNPAVLMVLGMASCVVLAGAARVRRAQK